MATYLAGVTDYIPQIQPFKPDLNFFQQALQLKQGQYDAAHKQLNNVYGTLLDSPMLRQSNIDRRLNFFKNISNEIHKISGLDLSRQENVEAAYQLFEPLVEDPYILKDMSFTKNLQSEYAKAENLRLCTDEEKCGGKFWSGGLRLLDYNMQDFTKATDEESLKFRNPKYVPYVNVTEKALKFAKEQGFNVESVTFTPDGRYQVSTKNGMQMIPSLTQAFLTVFGNDARIQDLYAAQATLQRRDFMVENAAQYGSEEAAEQYYLDTIRQSLEAQTKSVKQDVKTKSTDLDATINIIEKRIENDGLDLEDLNDQRVLEYYNQLLKEKVVLADNEQKTTEIETKISTEVLTGLDPINRRSFVDSAVARYLLTGDLTNAASSYAMLTAETKIEADPYAVAKFEHGLALDKMQKQFGYDMELEKYKTSLAILKKSYEDNPLGQALTPDGNELIPLSAQGGNTAISADLLTEDSKVVANATQGAAAAVNNLAQDTYNILNTIINSKNGTRVGKLLVDDALKTKAKLELEKIFGNQQAVEKVVTEESSFWDTPNKLLAASALLVPGMSGLFGSAIAARETEKKPVKKQVIEGGYLKNGSLIKLTEHPEFFNPDGNNYKQLNNNLNAFLASPIGADLIYGNVDLKRKREVVSEQLNIKSAQDRIIKNNMQATHNAIIANNSFGLNDAYSAQAFEKIYDPDKGDFVDRETFIKNYIENHPEYNNPFKSQTFNQALKVAKAVPVINYASMAADMFVSSIQEDAEKLYDEYVESFKRAYNKTEDSIYVPGYKPLSSGYTVGVTPGAGVQAQPYAINNNDTAFPGNLGTKDFAGIFRNVKYNLSDPSIANKMLVKFVNPGEDYTSADFYEDNMGVIDQTALGMLQMIESERVSGTKPTDQNRARWNQIVHPIIGNNANLVGFEFDLNPEFVGNNVGSEANPKFARGASQKVLVMFPKDAVSPDNEAIQRLNRGVYTTMMNAYGKVSLNEYSDYGGAIEATESANGGYDLSGYVYQFDEQFNLVPYALSQHISQNGANIDQIMAGYNNLLEENYRTNTSILSQKRQMDLMSKSNNLERDPRELQQMLQGE